MTTTITDRIAALYLAVLEDRLGLEVTRDGDVLLVPVEGRTYVVDLFAGDPECLRVALACRLEGNLPAVETAAIAAETGSQVLGAKIVVLDSVVAVVTSETVIAPPDCLPTAEMLTAVLPRAMDMATRGLAVFLRRRQVALELAGIAAASALVDGDVA